MTEEIPTSLYRHFGDDGSLLYVGISLSWPARTRSHARSSVWFEQVAKVEIERFPCRISALEAEREAIKSEHPKFNVIHNGVTSKQRKQAGPVTLPRRSSKATDPILDKIVGPHAIVGPALVYQGEILSIMVAHGSFGTAGELTEIVLGRLFPELPAAWTAACASVVTIRRADDITISEARDLRQKIVRSLQGHLETVQSFDTDLALCVAYATQFPSEKSRQILDQVAAEKGGAA